jgi:AbrB family looped-hinge helix DNA binding protein
MADVRGMAKTPVEVLKLGKRGEIVLPRRLRSSVGWREGEELVATVDDKRIVIERRARGFSAYLDVLRSGPPREE